VQNVLSSPCTLCSGNVILMCQYSELSTLFNQQKAPLIFMNLILGNASP